jgi:predicted exporter
VTTGPGVFAVQSRADIKRDAARFSLLGMLLVSAILLFIYRSIRVLGLTLVPVASGALAGIGAVSILFGFVHGVTLGFGVTLIGEAVDYAIYLFTNTAPGSTPKATLQRIWPTLRLGMLTSAFGFGAIHDVAVLLGAPLALDGPCADPKVGGNLLICALHPIELFELRQVDLYLRSCHS